MAQEHGGQGASSPNLKCEGATDLRRAKAPICHARHTKEWQVCAWCPRQVNGLMQPSLATVDVCDWLHRILGDWQREGWLRPPKATGLGGPQHVQHH